MKRSLLAVMFGALVLAACSSAVTPASAPAPRELTGTGGMVTVDGRSAAADQGTGIAAPAPAQNVSNPIPVPQAFNSDRALILTANVALRAKDAWSISDRAQTVAAAMGGDVIGLSQSGSGDQRSASLTLRVPAARFNDALSQLRQLDAEVVSSSVDGKDVTDQFVDLQARLRAKQAEEQRYLALLARAEKIDDILKLDNVLGQTRTQIEQLTGQVNSIKTRTEYATITVNIATAAVITPTPTTGWDPARSAALAVAALTALLRVFADLAIWTVVLGTGPVILALVAWMVLRGRRSVRPAV